MKQKITVKGMSCGHCKNAVEKAVKSLDGVSFAEVDLPARQLTIAFDAAVVSMEQIKAVIEEEGYTVM
ncbi:MAG: copper ion binding protein [Veillonellales bacterium]